MLNRFQFEVLSASLAAQPSGKAPTQREIANRAHISLGSVNKACKELKSMDFLDEKGLITPLGKSALTPYKVDNAIILAAGMATRFAPLSFEKPKAMFEVRGEIIIERMIRQLQEIGITDITLVVGCMKEAFFYLEDLLGVKIAVSPQYATRNNHASLYTVRGLLGNTYVCCSDEYYAENVFSPYAYAPYFSAVYDPAPSEEYVFTSVDSSNRVLKNERRGTDAFFARGPAYFDRAFSPTLIAAFWTAFAPKPLRCRWRALCIPAVPRRLGALTFTMTAKTSCACCAR